MNRDNAISRGDYLRPWEFIVETKFVEGFPISHALFDLPSDTRVQLWLTAETRRSRISNSNYVFISDEQREYRVSIRNTKLRTNVALATEFLSFSYYPTETKDTESGRSKYDIRRFVDRTKKILRK